MTACKKSTLKRYASDAKLAIFTVWHCAASYVVPVKPTKDQLGLIRPFQAKTQRRIALTNGPDFVRDLNRPAGSPARPMKRLFPT